MKNQNLIVDKKLADDLGLQDALVLFPCPGYQPNWSLPNEKFVELTYKIVQLKQDLSCLFANKIYKKLLPEVSLDALSMLFHAEGNGIIFFLCDRLYRLNRFAQYNSNFKIPTFNTDLTPTSSSHELQFHSIEGDPIFNQMILAELCPKNRGEVLPVPNIKILTVLTNKTQYKKDSWFLSKVKKLLWRFPGVWGPFSNFKHDVFQRKLPVSRALESQLLKVYLKILRNFGWRVYGSSFATMFRPVLVTTGVGLPDISGSFKWYWPFGYLGLLPQNLKRCSNTSVFAHATDVRKLIESELRNDISKEFKKFFLSLNEKIALPEETFENISGLMAKLFSDIYCKDLRKNFLSASTILKRCKAKSYLAHSLVGAEPNPFYACAARHLEMTNVSHQHSAWGGYLAGGALVSELLILGSDYYISFGWGEKETGLSSWRKGVVNNPSPLLSKLHIQSKNKLSKTTKRKNRILLPTGFLFRFPMIYNSALRIDTLNEWGLVIKELVAQLTQAGFEVDIKMYSEVTFEVWSTIFNSWIEAGAGKAFNFRKHDSSVRELIRTGYIEDNYDAIVWDVPTGGLTESFASKVPAFGLWNKNIINSTPNANTLIESLFSAGVLGSSGVEIANSINSFYGDEQFRQVYFQTTHVFLDKFCKVNDDWERSWRLRFGRLASGNYSND